MFSLTKIFFAVLFGVFVSYSFAQDSTNSMDNPHHMEMQGHMDHQNMMNHKMSDSTHKDMMKDSDSIVREGVIDLQAIDVNGDGMVYEDMMDWNVISDEPGKCPLCGMTLKEVTLEKAKQNLQKHDYQVK